MRKVPWLLSLAAGAAALLLLSPVATPAVHANGPNPYYTFDGQNANDSADSNNGTNHGATFPTDHPATSPVNSRSASISGNTAGAPKYIEVPDANVLDASGDFSVAGWVKTTATDAETIIAKERNIGGVDTQGWWVGTYQGGINVYLQQGSPAVATASIVSNTNINDGNWHAWAFTKSSAGLAVYIDGVLSDSTTMTVGDLSNNVSVRMGVYDLPAEGSSNEALVFNGNVDEVQVYQRALSASQIAILAGRVTDGAAGNQFGFNATGGVDCGGTDFAAFPTIQGAVDAATAGNAVFVCPGTYNEHVSVTTSGLQIVGRKFRRDARTRNTGSNETIVDGTLTGSDFDVDANDVLIDGFTLKNGRPAAVVQHANRSGTDADHTYFTGNDLGVAGNGANVTVYQDFFDGNGEGVASDQGASTTLIESNKFVNVGHPVTYGPGPGTTGLTISDNTIGNGNPSSGGPIELTGVTTGTISGNNDQHSSGGGILLHGNNSGITISNNTVNVAADDDLLISNDSATGPNDNLTVTNNTLTNSTGGYGVHIASGGISGNQAAVFVNMNSIANNAAGGIQNDNDTVINGKNNWWGDPSGPSVWSIGTGQSVSADVDFFPWATDSGLTSFRACDETVKNPHNPLNGTSANEVLCGKAGSNNDTIFGNGGNDLILGFGGNDQLVGGTGADAIVGDDYGNAGADTLYANNFSTSQNDDGQPDHLQGWLGSDTCYGDGTATLWSC